MTESDFSPDYLALRAANDLLRERGKAWIFDSLNELVLESRPELQVGRQEWEFKVDRSVMIGERIGIRYQGKTLTVEVGWPREPEHGFVPNQGLARGRISLSLSPMLNARPAEELILKTTKEREPVWYSIQESRLGEELTRKRLHDHLVALING